MADDREASDLLQPMGDGAWRARLPAGSDARALLDALRALAGVVDAVVSEEHALVCFDPASPPSPRDVNAALERAACGRGGAGGARPARLHTIGVRYDGEDLDEVARLASRTRDEVIALHLGGDYVVAAVGFLPGFAYLRGLDARLVVPRRETPRTRVPPLAVAVAGPYTGVYPFASPGGWRLIGIAVGFAPFDAQAGAALALGDRVRFERAPGAAP
jgi:UPF0271 protein